MYIVNRQVLIIRPKQPFLSWLKSVPDPNPLDISLESLRKDCTAVLIPEFDSESETQKYIGKIYRELFEMELNSWYKAEVFWPKRIDLKTFKEWFDIEIFSLVLDLLEEEIIKD